MLFTLYWKTSIQLSEDSSQAALSNPVMPLKISLPEFAFVYALEILIISLKTTLVGGIFTFLIVNIIKKNFYLLIDTKSLKIEKCMEDGLLRDYTVEVHALKTNARLIGATKLSEEFAHLESLGNEEDVDAIRCHTPAVLTHYRSYKEVLRPFHEKNQKEKREVPIEEILMYLKGIREAVDGFDLDEIDAAMAKLEECRLPEDMQQKMEKLLKQQQ